MKRFSTTKIILIALSALFVTAMVVISLISALSILNKPFPGFLIYPNPYIGSYSLKDWPGRQAGLKFADRIVAVNGQPVFHGRDVLDVVEKKQPGTPIRYRVESDHEIREVTVPVSVFGIRDLLLTFGTIFPCGLVLCVLGIIVVLLKPNISSSWVFLVLGLSLGGYLMTGLESMTSHTLIRLHVGLAVVYPVVIFHLALIFPERKKILNRFPALEYLIYLPAFVLAVALQVYISTFSDLLREQSLLSSILNYKNIGSVIRLYLLLSVLFFVIVVLHSLFKATTTLDRQRARMIFFGLIVGFLPPVAIMLGSHILKASPTWNFLPFFVIFFPASIAYSIVRHNLFDADVIIRRTLGYALVTAIVVGAYLGVSLIFNVLFEKYQLAHSKAFPILFTLGVILIFNPLRDRIQAMVDRIFFRKEYDYGAIVEKVSEAMTSLLELPKILNHLVETFIDDMFVDTGSVMLLTPDGSQYKVYLADGEKKQAVEDKAFKREDPLFEIIETEKRELTKFDVLEDPKYQTVSESSAADFETLHASLMIPLVYQNQVIGSMNLGEKKSGKPFNREDIELLRTLAHQGAVAIENARLFQENLEKQRMEEELNIARDLQMSMLPATCPEIQGFKIAASSTPAREVGGDFYDFIEIGDGRAGVVVADVTGKSVSGALVMSASRSVFRMLSEVEMSVSESMMRANRRLKQDVKTGMFVALLFAVLNSEDKTLTLCSAGQTQPIHLSAKTGEAMLVETEGDTFPLGILEDASYEETRLQLEPGDRVLLYTDGIVEAMNGQEEIFGFERLLDTVNRAASMSAEELLQEILGKVNEFSGDAPQHDDLTLIVMSVE
jgi:sigma-B regulation protein RsbU (phosphoserine phosphatase)